MLGRCGRVSRLQLWAMTSSFRPFSSAPRRAQGFADLRLRCLRYQTWAWPRMAERGRQPIVMLAKDRPASAQHNLNGRALLGLGGVRNEM